MDIADALELCGIVVGAITGIAGIVWAAIKFGGNVAGFAVRVGRVLATVDSFHSLFGDSPAQELHRIVIEVNATLGELEIRQRIAARHLALGIFVTKPSGETTWVNDCFAEEFELDSTEMLGFGWLASVAREDRDRVHREWLRSVQDHLPYREHYRVSPDGSRKVWTVVSEAWPVISGDEIVCYVGYVKKQNTVSSEVFNDS